MDFRLGESYEFHCPNTIRPKVQIAMRRCHYFILLLPMFAGCRTEPSPTSTAVGDTGSSIVHGPTSSQEVDRPAPAEPEAGSRRLGYFGPMVGQPAPPLEGMDLAGKPLKLADFRGKVVVVDFWRTACPPCSAMLPHERELVKRMKDRPFVLLAVNVGTDGATPGFKAFLEKEQMTWPNICDGESQAVAWFATSPPTLDVVDAKGVYRYFSVEEKDLDAVVEKLVKEAESAK
jgi:thiol-disulfide isomerase/thioredoxin